MSSRRLMSVAVPLLSLLMAEVGSPRAACGQDTVSGWPGLDPSRLSTVYVLDDAGKETSGRLLRIDAQSLVLLAEGAEVRFEAARVRRIQKRGDSLRNGAIIGAVVGVAMGLVSAGISDCPGDDPGGECPSVRVAAFLASTGIYAAIGTGIDALRVGRTTLYERRAAPAGAAGGRTAITLGVRW